MYCVTFCKMYTLVQKENASLQLYSFIFELLANKLEIDLSSKLHCFLYSIGYGLWRYDLYYVSVWI